MLPAIAIITPCYNESEIIIRFLRDVERCLAPLSQRFRVVVVDDHSSDDTLALLRHFSFQQPHIELEIVALDRNLGHQQAIYQGFLHGRKMLCDHFIVMDSDGEDSPAIIPYLLQHLDADIVHVVRNQRRESLQFRLLYRIYKVLFRLINGRRMDFGNFCLISRPVLEHAASSGFLHLAAFLSKQEGVKRSVAADRDVRLGGKSKMGFTGLLRHALNSFAEYRRQREPAPAQATDASPALTVLATR